MFRNHVGWSQGLLSCGLLLCLLWATPQIGAQPEFVRGDFGGDHIVDLTDVLASLDYLFQNGPFPDCEKALDSNDDAVVNIADPLFTLLYLFVGGAPPELPFPDCGLDPTPDGLSCNSHDACDLGGPLDGLTESEYQAFARGKVLMVKRFTPEEGLGPFYNTTSCLACHEEPVVGGSAPIYRNFFLVGIGPEGSQTPIQDPELPSLVLPSYGAIDGPRPNIPEPGPDPVTVTQRNAPPMFGTGLFEFISNDTIISNSDPDDTITPDGISGRFNTDGNMNLGRFGYKLQANFIEPFIRGAAQNQMGMTTNPVLGSGGVVTLRQVGGPLDDPTMDTDNVQDPEILSTDFADLIAFSKFLRPPKKKPFGPDEFLGEMRFDEIGCTSCHIPSLPSSLGPVEAYTDLLLHDMGPDLADGIHMGEPQVSQISPDTTGSEFRTQPLWGVSLHAPFLHDGRAHTLFEAIDEHGGEAQASRDAFLALPGNEQDAVIKFLEAL